MSNLDKFLKRCDKIHYKYKVKDDETGFIRYNTEVVRDYRGYVMEPSVRDPRRLEEFKYNYRESPPPPIVRLRSPIQSRADFPIQEPRIWGTYNRVWGSAGNWVQGDIEE